MPTQRVSSTCETCPHWLRLDDAFLLEHFGQRGICEEYQRIAAHIDPYSLLWTLPGEGCERHPGEKERVNTCGLTVEVDIDRR